MEQIVRKVGFENARLDALIMKLMTHRMGSLIEGIVLTITWFAAMLASLSIHQFGFANEHSICGPWGCGPTNGALLAVHIGWLIAVWPPLLYLPWRFGWSKSLCRRLGMVLTSLGLAGVLGIAAWQWLVWLPQAGEFSRPFIWQRCGFAIATAVDWPLMQFMGIGVCLFGMKSSGNVDGQTWKPNITARPSADVTSCNEFECSKS